MDAQAETLFQVGLSEADVVAGTGSEFDPSRLIALVAIVLRLQDAMKREAIQPWLNTGVSALHVSKPIDLIGQGNTDLVMRLISGMEGMVAS